jgi:hypothetical protein
MLKNVLSMNRHLPIMPWQQQEVKNKSFNPELKKKTI